MSFHLSTCNVNTKQSTEHTCDRDNQQQNHEESLPTHELTKQHRATRKETADN